MADILNSDFLGHGSDFPSHFAITILKHKPIIKEKGDALDTNNYRGIAVGSLFCELL